VVEGQGIGLYLTKKIMDAAGGDIVVESEPGKGSKFILYFKAEDISSEVEISSKTGVEQLMEKEQ
jgi:signal transduction histidine kinase